jgi:hypothetical protein
LAFPFPCSWNMLSPGLQPSQGPCVPSVRPWDPMQ